MAFVCAKKFCFFLLALSLFFSPYDPLNWPDYLSDCFRPFAVAKRVFNTSLRPLSRSTFRSGKALRNLTPSSAPPAVLSPSPPFPSLPPAAPPPSPPPSSPPRDGAVVVDQRVWALYRRTARAETHAWPATIRAVDPLLVEYDDTGTGPREPPETSGGVGT